MGGGKYINITAIDFHDVMTQYGYECSNPDGPGELVYKKRWNDNNYGVKVYSSITPFTGKARKVGEDAIRIIALVIDKKQRTYKAFWKKRCYRITTWRKNLIAALAEAELRGCATNPQWKCPWCSAPLVLRDGTRGEFWGCSQYPNCRGLRNIEDESKQQSNKNR